MFEVRRLRRLILHDVDFSVAAGEIVAIVGESGSGKTLLLRALADLDPNQGEVSCGQVQREAVPAPQWRRLVGYIAAEPAWWHERIADHFSDRASALHDATALGIGAQAFDRSVSLASTGERQRLALLRTLENSPEVLLLDEPTSSLDPESKEKIEALLRRKAKQGTAIVIVTHDAAQAERLADRTLYLSQGRLAERETKRAAT